MKISRIILAFLLTFVSAQPPAHAEEADSSVRIAAVNIADDILKPLIDQFHKSGSSRVKIVYTGNDPFSVARAGKADMVIAHYGHPMVQGFIEAGYGLFPRPVFANQVAIIGPASDPARIKGLSDGAEAIRRIANAGEKIHTNGHGANYLLDLLSISAGVPGNTDFVVKSNLRQGCDPVCSEAWRLHHLGRTAVHSPAVNHFRAGHTGQCRPCLPENHGFHTGQSGQDCRNPCCRGQ